MLLDTQSYGNTTSSQQRARRVVRRSAGRRTALTLAGAWASDRVPGKDDVLAATEPVVVLLGAGTGKTSAAAAVWRELDSARTARTGPRRALFLSFSRAAVSQILDRTADTLGDQAPFVEVTTFDAFVWHSSSASAPPLESMTRS